MLKLTKTDLPKFSYGVCIFIRIAYIMMYAQSCVGLLFDLDKFRTFTSSPKIKYYTTL